MKTNVAKNPFFWIGIVAVLAVFAFTRSLVSDKPTAGQERFDKIIEDGHKMIDKSRGKTNRANASTGTNAPSNSPK